MSLHLRWYSRLRILIKIPAVAVNIFKHHNRTVLFLTRFFAEMNAFCLHGMVIAPKVIRLKEQEYSATALITDKTFLPLVRRTSQQDIAVALRVG